VLVLKYELDVDGAITHRDQLWTNGGAYKPPNPGEEYPPDLRGYPVPGDGYVSFQLSSASYRSLM
jgi:hypothetical protein